MRLLFDQNLAPRLSRSLKQEFGNCAHVRDFDLQSATDRRVWEFAIENGYTIVSKDSDFHQLALLRGPPPKVVWIRRGNCSTDEIAGLLIASRSPLEQFVEDPVSAFLTLE